MAIIPKFDFRDKIIEDLDLLRKKEQQERNIFKARAYEKVLKELRAFTQPIHSIEDIANIPGIGDRIYAKIEEIINTGKLAVAEVIKQDSKVGATDTIMKIYGIGPVKASDLIKNHGIRSIADLREAVIKAPGLLNDKQMIGLKYYEDILERIPRSEMLLHENKILKLVSSVNKDFKTSIVGSFRRETPTSGDIDVLIGYPENITDKNAEKIFKEIIAAFTILPSAYMTDVLAQGPKKCMGVVKLGGSHNKARRIDLLLTPPEEFAYAQLYFTGSDKFNIQIRKKAIDKGYSLSEHGLKMLKTNIQKPPTMKTEKDILDFLESPYLEPKDR
jgi:DNA polymerase lambda